MISLTGKIALVTGASRGVGKGAAIGLGEAGATVYVTGRTTVDKADRDKMGGTVQDTAEAVTAAGGRGVAVRCDHANDADTDALFQQIDRDSGSLDILVNNAWAGYESMVVSGEFTWMKPFWEQPFWRWDAMFQSGVRAAYTASALAARRMIARKRGLIVNISFWSAQKYMANTAYGVAKAAVDKMAAYMAYELKDHNVAVVSLYPGLVRTERVMVDAQYFDLGNSESPQFTGRVIAALAADPQVMRKSGQVLVVAAEALEYGIPDVDGKQPVPATLETA